MTGIIGSAREGIIIEAPGNSNSLTPNFYVMSVTSKEVSKWEKTVLKIADEGATKAIQALPKEKQNIAIGGLFVAGTLLFIVAGLMYVKKHRIQ